MRRLISVVEQHSFWILLVASVGVVLLSIHWPGWMRFVTGIVVGAAFWQLR